MEDNSKVEVREIGYSNDGLFAIEDFRMGEKVFVERAALTFSEDQDIRSRRDGLPVCLTRKILEDPAEMARFKKMNLYANKWKKGLPKKEKVALHCVAKDLGVPFRKVHNIYRAIAAYNYLASNFSIGPEGRRSGLVLVLVMGACHVKMNHSCEPNCVFHIEVPEQGNHIEVTAYAAKGISAGDELTVSYFGDNVPSLQFVIDDNKHSAERTIKLVEKEKKVAGPHIKPDVQSKLNQNVKMRRQHLKREYGFLCMCSRCTLEANETSGP